MQVGGGSAGGAAGTRRHGHGDAVLPLHVPLQLHRLAQPPAHHARLHPRKHRHVRNNPICLVLLTLTRINT